MISSDADDGPLGTILGCANCFYHFGQTYCNLKRQNAERARRILTARGGEHRFVDRVLEDLQALDGGSKGSEEDVDDDNNETVDDNDDSDAVADDSEMTPTPGVPPKGITEAEPGRPYNMWPGEWRCPTVFSGWWTDDFVSDESGQLMALSGALLPVGYQLDTTYPGRPWVCPVRDCRKAHCKRSDLGFHFSVC
jgi:hypothetical protein